MGKIKLLLIGDEEVGKTTLRKRFMGQKHTVSYLATIGADFAKKETSVNFKGQDYLIESLIWDLAGQDAYKVVRAAFYEGASGALLIVDISRKETITNMEKWVEELWTNNGSGPIPFAILANKSDLREKDPSKVISKEETEELVIDFRNKMLEKAKFKFTFLETSALDGINVDEAFDILLKEILENTLTE
ncbi:MAG: GTPase KRas precursor [Candidatus Heimdallarchaeota archaeon LC_3]|nr:MAG: GTPase KRas precursor [Candidatus Heimdallarchaeota archaeon LC_3]